MNDKIIRNLTESPNGPETSIQKYQVPNFFKYTFIKLLKIRNFLKIKIFVYLF